VSGPPHCAVRSRGLPLKLVKLLGLLLLVGAGCSGDDSAAPAAGGTSQTNAGAGGGAGLVGSTVGSGGSAGSATSGGGGDPGSAGDGLGGANDSGAAIVTDSAAALEAGHACDGGATDWGKALVDSTRKRLPTPAALGGWGYQPALFLHGVFLVYKRTHDPSYLAYIKAWVDASVPANGDINNTFDSVDSMMPGQVLLDLYEETKDARYKTAADKIRKRFDTYPRTGDGAFWHNTGLVGQNWGDGVFMALPFLERYGHLFADAAYVDDETTKQLLLYHDHLQHPAGVHYHAWDEQGDAAWTNPATKHSPESWCRANGWYAMATIEVLEGLPATHPNRQAVITILQGLIEGVTKLQDPATGRWFQVIDKATAPGNWLETSCTSMLSYSISRAVQRGYVPEGTYASVAAKAFQGAMQKITLDAGGMTNVADICIGTSVGDLAYYLARTRATNDFHGLGAFLIMYEQLTQSCL